MVGQFVEYLEPVRAAFREKRYVLREFSYDVNKSGGIDAQIQQANNELKQTKATIARWCKTHFGEVYSGWMHLKVIQLFVESVLRYGVPPDFVPIFVLYDSKVEKELRVKLTATILNLRPELRLKRSLATEEGEEAENVSEENLPFVCLRFPVIGGNSA